MGMYDDVTYEMNCPDCGTKVDGFQSKDGPCSLLTLSIGQVYNFYASCPKCDRWIEFNRKADHPVITTDDINDFVLRKESK